MFDKVTKADKKMTISKDQLIDSLYKMMCTYQRPNQDERIDGNSYFKRRIEGFRAEIEFEKYAAEQGVQFLEGGQFISEFTNTSRSQRHFIYTTVSFEDPADYVEIYSNIADWDEINNLYYIQISNQSWTNESFIVKDSRNKLVEDRIIKPVFQFYTFDKLRREFNLSSGQSFLQITQHFTESTRTISRSNLRNREYFNYFQDYDLEDLKKIYANRYFLSVVLKKFTQKNIIDLDGFIKTSSGISIVEVKEKSPIKNENDPNNTEAWSYGWDTRRILWYLYIQTKMNSNVYYFVRRINNRTHRVFERWDHIEIKDFLKGIGWSSSISGGGHESTLTASFSLFNQTNPFR
jgi:hypothetical protein